MAFFSCHTKSEPQSKEDLKKEIIETERNFNNLAQTNGIAEAFCKFADEDAIIKREKDTLIKGKENIKKYYSDPSYQKAQVSWKPDFVEVSEDGTLAYTYGKYIWTIKDSVGITNTFKGVFHTVWKKQNDASWKYVWD